jgi:hypothetical protein
MINRILTVLWALDASSIFLHPTFTQMYVYPVVQSNFID